MYLRKENMSTIYQKFIGKSKDIGEGIVEAIVSTDSLDRHEEIVDLKGLDVSNYMQNPVVLFAHDSNSLPVGKTLSLVEEGGRLIAKMKFAVKESAFAREVYELIKGGYLNAFSIGFIPKETEDNVYTKAELLEYSVVPIPANPRALVVARSKGIKTDLVEKELYGEEFVNERKEYEGKIKELEDSLLRSQEVVEATRKAHQKAIYQREVNQIYKTLKEVTKKYEQRIREQS